RRRSAPGRSRLRSAAGVGRAGLQRKGSARGRERVGTGAFGRGSDPRRTQIARAAIVLTALRFRNIAAGTAPPFRRRTPFCPSAFATVRPHLLVTQRQSV